MAANADSVVVELIAKTEQLDKPVQQSAAQFDANMNKIVASATKAEAAVTASSSARSAALQRESAQISQFSGILARDMDVVGAKLLSPSSPFVAPVREGPKVASAMRLVSTGGALLGNVLGGVLLSAGVAAIAMLVELASRTDKHKAAVDALVEKLREHARQTHLSEEADRVWSQTIDGLIERNEKLTKTLKDRLNAEEDLNRQTFETASSERTDAERKLAEATKRYNDLKAEFDAASRQPRGVGIGQGAATGGVDDAVRARNLAKLKTDLDNAKREVDTAQAALTQSTIVWGEAQAKALTDSNAAVDLWSKNYIEALHTVEQKTPESTVKLTAAFDAVKAALSDAASADVPFKSAADSANALGRDLIHGKTDVDQYAAAMKALAAQLEAVVEAAKEANKNKVDPVQQFKQAVIGAEGTGANKLGSSAAGFGQFMPDTWRHYFDKLFPDKADIDDAAKLAYRNIRSVAEAVIDKATDDYAAVLKSAGQKVTAAGLYTVHLLGAPDAKKLLSAAPQTPTSQVLSPQVLSGNPFLKGTVQQAEAAIAKRIGDSSAAVSRGAATLQQTLDRGAKDLQDQIQEEKERAARYIAEKSGFEEQVIEARKGLATTAEEMWAFETAANIAAKQHTDDQIAAQEEARKLLPQEAEELKRINGERAKYRQQLVDQRLAQAQSAREAARNDNAVNIELGLLSAQEENLHSVEQLAKTSTQKKQIEDRLIDLQFAELRIRLEAQIAEAARLKALAETTKNEQDIAAATKAEADAAVARAKLQGLPQQQAEAHQANADQNAAPLQAYFNSIPDTAAEINDAFENIAVHGLQTFNDALTDAIVNYRSLGDVGRAVLQGLEADLIKLALQLIEQHTIGAALGSASTAAATAQAAVLGAAWAGPAALASLASYGANAIPAQAAMISTAAIGAVIGAPKATGGRIFGPGSDTSDGILTPTSRDEYVINAPSARALGYDTLDYLNAHGSLPGGFANGGRIQPMNMSAASPNARGGFSAGDMAELRGIVGQAIDAMPAIHLHPVVDSEEVFTRGIKTNGGSKAMVAHVAANSTKYKATLNRPGS
jgi:hypothetical protein